MNKVITKIRSGIGGYLKDNILFLTFVFASVLNGFLLRAFTLFSRKEYCIIFSDKSQAY